MKLPISWLSGLMYCEYSFYLQHVIGLSIKTPQLVRGVIAHKELQVEHEAKADIEITIPEALQRAIKHKEHIIMRGVDVEDDVLVGRADQVLISPKLVVIVDDKPSNKAFKGYKLQLYGYARTFKNSYKPIQQLMVALRNWETKKIVWKSMFTKEANLELENTIKRAFAFNKSPKNFRKRKLLLITYVGLNFWFLTADLQKIYIGQLILI